MSGLESIVTKLNDIIWSMPLVFLCLGAGIFLSIRLRFPQFRHFKDMSKLAFSTEKSDSGISPFQSFATTVGSRVGMGNIAGVAAAIYFGGPGAVFWMWLISILGSASAFTESSLAQAYKTRLDGLYVGGPQRFIEKGLKYKGKVLGFAKIMAMAFAVSTIIGPGITMPGVQTNSIAQTFDDAFGVPYLVTGIVISVLIALVVSGGVKRIGVTAELLAPVMCVIYILLVLIVVILNIKAIPGVFASIFSSAFGLNQTFAGIMGATISWGVKRGVYSNEAGQGSGAIVSAACETSHPAKQGLVQGFSVYIDTILICSASAVLILATNTFNVVDAGGAAIVENVPGVQYGIMYAQTALNAALPGTWPGKVLAVCVVLFVFTSLMGYYYQAESNVTYLFKGKKSAVWAFRAVFVLSTFSGVLMEGAVLWTIADLGVGLMAWFNIIAILLMSNQSVKLLKDYEAQKKAGKDPKFDPSLLDIDDAESAWKKA